MNIQGKSHPVQASIEATIIRADGRREQLGTVSYWHRRPLLRLLYRLRRLVGPVQFWRKG